MAYARNRVAACLACLMSAALLAGVARADPTLIDPDLTPAERVAQAQLVVIRELADHAQRPGLPLSGRFVEGDLVIERVSDHPGVYALPGGAGRLTTTPRDGFRLLLPRVGDVAAVEAGQAPVVQYVSLFSGSMTLHLSSDADYLDRFETVELLRRAPNLTPDGVAYVELRVSRTTPDVGSETLIRHSEADFATLRRLHRADFDAWALPLLRDLGLGEAVEGETRSAAVAVFLTELSTPDADAAAVREAADALASDDFARRSAARRTLADLGVAGASEAVRMLRDRDDLTDEQRAGLSAAAAQYQVLSPGEIERLSSDRDFLAEVLALDGPDDAPLRDAARRRLDGADAE